MRDRLGLSRRHQYGQLFLKVLQLYHIVHSPVFPVTCPGDRLLGFNAHVAGTEHNSARAPAIVRQDSRDDVLPVRQVLRCADQHDLEQAVIELHILTGYALDAADFSNLNSMG